MGLSLQKGGNISLSEAASLSGSKGSLNQITIGLGWDDRITSGAEFDLDASAFLLNGSNKVRGDHDFIFYNQLESACGSLVHQGDNLDGGEDGEYEVIVINLQTLPGDVERICFVMSIIDEADTSGQNFGMVSNPFIRVVNMNDNVEIARYDLSEDASIETAMIFAEVYKHIGEWNFKAVGQGFQGGLGPLARHYGVNV